MFFRLFSIFNPNYKTKRFIKIYFILVNEIILHFTENLEQDSDEENKDDSQNLDKSVDKSKLDAIKVIEKFEKVNLKLDKEEKLDKGIFKIIISRKV